MAAAASAAALWLRGGLRGIAAVSVVAALYFPAALQAPVVVPGKTRPSIAPSSSYSGPTWETWSPDRLRALRADGPVFVNFTAAWCITCKVNEVVALDSATRAQGV
ncbi:MAG: thioredoxin family protein [Gammaproteobacteria bacterium]|nr:thioredoxin family protein [Gammaproteobacteria bacterium]